ncbi:MAG TPA: Crp/Fnr family transcriptional regulator [Leptospiraceae bacterium]|nr:Crp/Fnr family transcriptional regulator [Leptospiraceae bacterium]HMW06920.1 Crp/Fnr family transcriptional regulator [Leptospiraceae bacterium]HMX32282.1 Crp/Fnr family transcriptional regulator [Leptospiraceae bacterium]HMY33450.1 Crp/Fnr family transcriptional regulator [Leptospiraceae bacterium]HMZ65484.1 Crp/Fnr family transcriptional regulator [Leptospiraceae bacterium]
MNYLITTLSATFPLSNSLEEELSKNTKILSLKKKKYLIEKGQTANHLYFVNEGLLRGFYFQKRKNITTWFAKEQEFVTSIYSFVSRKPLIETIEALEDCQLTSISYEDLQRLYSKHMELNRIGRILMEKYFIELEERAISLQHQTAKERYTHFLNRYSDLFHRVKLGHIASFLGITNETLSRIRS